MKRKPDPAHAAADKALAALEKRITAEYRKAADELQEKIGAYFARFEEQDAEQLQLLQAGKITRQQYTQWRLAQIGRGRRFEALRGRVAERMTQANELAAAYINDTTPGLYSLNRNYAAYTIERQAGADVGFDLWDEQTVKRLIVERPDLMPYYPPERAVKRGVDLAYGKRQITAQVTSGILQGESIRQLADRLQTNIPDMNRTSAIRAARTAVTGAQNAGRMDGFRAAEEMGIRLKKRWLSTLDGRTRHAHRLLDGQVQPTDAPFQSELGDIMFPGDPDAVPANVYNCRCTLIAEVEGADMSDARRRARDPVTGESEVIQDMTYQEWVERKKSVNQVAGSSESGIMEKTDAHARKPIFTQEQTIEMAKKFAESPEYEKISSFQELRAVTNKKLGYDGLPTVVSVDEFEHIAVGKTRLYRGVKSSGDKTADEIVSEFKRGPLWTGNAGGAVFGNGVYFTETKDIALGDYAGLGGALIEAVLDETSRVADYKTVYQEFLDTGIPRIIGEKEDYQLILGDVGQYAALKGYDAIALNGFLGRDYVVLLNRTKAIVRE